MSLHPTLAPDLEPAARALAWFAKNPDVIAMARRFAEEPGLKEVLDLAELIVDEPSIKEVKRVFPEARIVACRPISEPQDAGGET